MFSIVNVGGNVQLAQAFVPEGILVTQSTSNSIKSTTNTIRLYLLNDNDDQILHMSIRPSQNVIVFNSRTASGNFGPEERVAISADFGSHTPTVTFYDHGDRYQVMIDYKTVIYYNKRQGLDGPVTRVGYAADGDSFLSDALGVTLYPSFADLYPRNV
ncbi:hypothetical protein AX17_005502 [Amanita inopinata Kibby_2008]|nr:hypothetical protein AX17_005502 [Amanita inopinata Kibby_2008]